MLTRDAKINFLIHQKLVKSDFYMPPMYYVLLAWEVSGLKTLSMDDLTDILGTRKGVAVAKMVKDGYLRKIGSEYATTFKGRERLKKYNQYLEDLVLDMKYIIKSKTIHEG